MDKIRFYANVTKTELPFIRIEEGAFEGMILLVDTGSNDNILFGHFYNQAKEMFQPMEGSRDTYGIEGTIRQRNMVNGIVSFCGTEYEMQFTVQENDDCAILLSKEMGFPVFGVKNGAYPPTQNGDTRSLIRPFSHNGSAKLLIFSSQ